MQNELHPLFKQILAPWTPPVEVPSMEEQIKDEWATGLDGDEYDYEGNEE